MNMVEAAGIEPAVDGPGAAHGARFCGRTTIDRSYLEDWGRELGLGELLANARTQAGFEPGAA